MTRTAVVTGASSGIGAATVRRLRRTGWDVVGVARRTERLAALAAETGCSYIAADLTDADAVWKVRAELESRGGIDALVNNAGGAIGKDTVEQGSVDDWQTMFDRNVLATKRMTTALLPLLREGVRAGQTTSASIVTVTSTAAYGAYRGGGGYNAAKFAERALVEALRLELNGEPIRVIEIAPGMVATEEFSLVRFRGDAEKAHNVYDDIPAPLTADDIADAIAYTLEAPAHVNVDSMTIRPVAQAASYLVAKGELRVQDEASTGSG